MIATAYEFGSKAEAAQLLGLRSADSVKHYRKKWIDKIHFYKRPGGNRAGYLYNLTLIRNWIQCHEDVNDPNHCRAIADYLRSLNPKKHRRKHD